jgi:hypothetical protein
MFCTWKKMEISSNSELSWELVWNGKMKRIKDNTTKAFLKPERRMSLRSNSAGGSVDVEWYMRKTLNYWWI